jgi:hypothetical protein
VWLAFADDVPMPPIGFGNQFGSVIVATEKDCETRDQQRPADEKYVAKCTKWYQQQLKYRARFKKLFARQWLITDYYREESFAAPAYTEIVHDFASDQPQYSEEIPKVLKPAESSLFTAYLQHYGGQPGYRFSVNIPWEVMPPANSLEISRLRLLVEVYSPAPPGKKFGPYASTAPYRKYGKPETFNLLSLKTRHKIQISPCGGKLEVKNKYDEALPGWLLPAAGPQGWVPSIFGITNEALGYMYEPDGLSPIAFQKNFFYKQVAPDEWVCGPEFKYRKGTEIKDYDRQIDEQGLEVRKLPDGVVLVKEGPFHAYSTFGSGQCGGCATAHLAIYAIGNDRKLAELLEFSDFVDESKLVAEQIEVSPDWNTVSRYQAAYEKGTGRLTWKLSVSDAEVCGNEQTQPGTRPAPHPYMSWDQMVSDHLSWHTDCLSMSSHLGFRSAFGGI